MRQFLVQYQLENIQKILDAEVTYLTCCDRTTQHKKIEIIYQRESK